MRVEQSARRWVLTIGAAVLAAGISVPAQQSVTETRDPKQTQDEDFAKSVKEWTTQPYFISPLVDHLPKVAGIPTPKDVLGYHIGAPAKLTYYADILKYYKALAAATPRVQIETIGKSDEDRELLVVWISSDANIKNLKQNRANLAKIADPRGLSDAEVKRLIATTKPQYHLMGGLHSGETGPSEMLMELAYRLVTETSPLINGIRENVIVSITPVADPDGRDRNVDWFYKTNQELDSAGANAGGAGAAAGGAGANAGGAGAAAGGAGTTAGGAGAAPNAQAPGGGRGAAPAAEGGGGGGGRRRCGVAVLGQVRVPRQQPRHQPLAGVDARACGLLLHGLPADHARPARVVGAALHLQRWSAPESQSRSDPLHGAAVLLELRAGADDEVRDAGCLHARLHGRLVAGLPRFGRLQPQRHDADVRNAVGQRASSGCRRWPRSRRAWWRERYR